MVSDRRWEDAAAVRKEVVAGDEGSVARTVQQLVRESTGRVYVAIFSSNVMRLRSLLQVAQSCDRKVTYNWNLASISVCMSIHCSNHRLRNTLNTSKHPGIILYPLM